MIFDIPQEEKSIIKVIGVGGGGCNAVAFMYNQGIKGVDFAICNTDNQSMDTNPIPTKIQLGPHLTEGRGAGSRPEIGKQACIESIDDVRRFLGDGTKMLFITAGMGGGTGTGAAPIIAKAAKEMDILSVGIVTLPFKFEGLRRQRQGLEGLDEMKKHVDAILVISNDKLRLMHGNLSLANAFGEADNILTTAAKGIAEIITVPGHINVDFEDVNTVMRDSGVAIMGSAVMEGEDRAKKAIEAALNSPLLEDNDIRGAQHILLNITSGNKEATMDEIGEITEYVQEEAGYGTDLIWGYCCDENLGDKISVTLIATGFEEGGTKTEHKEESKIVVSLDDEKIQKEEIEMPSTLDYITSESATTFEFEDIDVPLSSYDSQPYSYKEPYVKNAEPESRDVEFAKKKQELENMRREFLRQNKSVQIDNPKTVVKLENEPAYKRRNVNLDDVDHSAEEQMSKYTLSIDDDNPEIESNNSFLHDNVD
jgi:cell division protein FtsZ